MIDARSRQPVPDVVVTATSPNLRGEQTVVTDAQGVYRIPGLPPGVYTLRFEVEQLQPYTRSDIELRLFASVRVNVELLPEYLEEIVEVLYCGDSVVDEGGTTTGQDVDSDRTFLLATSGPSGEHGAARTVDSLAEWVPGVTAGTAGFSVHGATPYENEYLVDGLSTRDAASGLDALPVHSAFRSLAQVLTAGALPEYGRGTGGVLEVATDSGSGFSELHGDLFAHWAPGLLEGRRGPVPGGAGGSELRNLGDAGFTLGGPVQDRLWFFVGAVPTVSRVEHSDGARTSLTDQRSLQPRRLQGLPRFVLTRGGEYCFMPGLRALRWLPELRT